MKRLSKSSSIYSSALSSAELTGEDLGYKTRVAEKVKFEYSPLGKVFIKN